MTAGLLDARVAVVSGKGGAGKTTVAAALSLAASRAGRQTLAVEVEGREALGPLFGAGEIGYRERSLAPNLHGISVVPDEALVEYLALFWGIPKLSRALTRSKAVEFATNTAPGLRDILLIGKVKEAERRRHDGAYAYDLIVVDAPPSGRLPRFLDAPRAVAELVHGGPIQAQAQGVIDMVGDPKRCQVILVTLAEDMSVRETAETAERLRKMGVAVGPVVVNAVWPAAPGLGDDPAETLARAASSAGLPLGDEAVARLAAVAEAHAARVANQREAIEELRRELAAPQIHLPYLFTPRLAAADVDRLAARLREETE